MSLIPKLGRGSRTEVEPRTSISRLRTEMDRLFDRFVQNPWTPFAWSETMPEMERWAPTTDLSETDTEIAVRAELPGVAPEDVKVTFSNHCLMISGEKKISKEEKGEDFYHSERTFGSFRRMIELPETIDTNKIVAEQTDGVLTVRIPKLPSAKPRLIEVKQTNGQKTTKRVPVSTA